MSDLWKNIERACISPPPGLWHKIAEKLDASAAQVGSDPDWVQKLRKSEIQPPEVVGQLLQEKLALNYHNVSKFTAATGKKEDSLLLMLQASERDNNRSIKKRGATLRRVFAALTLAAALVGIIWLSFWVTKPPFFADDASLQATTPHYYQHLSSDSFVAIKLTEGGVVRGLNDSIFQNAFEDQDLAFDYYTDESITDMVDPIPKSVLSGRKSSPQSTPGVGTMAFHALDSNASHRTVSAASGQRYVNIDHKRPALNQALLSFEPFKEGTPQLSALMAILKRMLSHELEKTDGVNWGDPLEWIWMLSAKNGFSGETPPDKSRKGK